MSRMKLTTLREMNDHDLEDKLLELKADLAKLRSEGAKGTLKKESASIRWARRDIARILTLINERKIEKRIKK
jgi:large subunit ribosomal protein L29